MTDQKDRFRASASVCGIWGKFVQSLPVIVFFLLMFYAVVLLFGRKYMMVVSLSTLYFQNNYKKQHTAASLLALVAQQLFLGILAYAATWNLLLCLLLNLVVPFWLIFSKELPQPFIFQLIQLLFSRFFCHIPTTFFSPPDQMPCRAHYVRS